MDISLEYNQHNINPSVRSDASKQTRPHSHPCIKAILASTLPANILAARECVHDTAPPVCSAGAGGIDEAALDDGDTELSSVATVVEDFSCELATADEPDSCEEEECACFALSVVSIGGR